MFTIHINLGDKMTDVSIVAGHTARQILDYLRQNHFIPGFQGYYELQFNGGTLPMDESVGLYGVGPGAVLSATTHQRIGFGGSGKETLLNNLLKGFSKLK